MSTIPLTRHLRPLLPLLAALTLLVTGCQVVVSPGPGGPSGFTLRSASYTTNHQGPNDTDIICDNQTTFLRYSFVFDGELRSWTSYLKGASTGEIAGEQTFGPSTPGVDYRPGNVTVTYEIRPGAAPQGIGVNPKTSYTRLFLRVNGSDRAYDLLSRDIPVVSEC